MPLRLRARLRSLRLQPPITSIRLKLARFYTVVQKPRKHFIDDVIAERWIFDWECDLDAPQKISRHPIRAREQNFGRSGIGKMINPAVLEEAPNNTDHMNVFAEARDFRSQTADAAHD